MSEQSSQWTYLLLYSDKFGSRDAIKAFIDSQPEVAYWYTCMNHSFLIVSSLTANALAQRLRNFSGERGRFLLLDTETDRDGWLPRQAWEIMRDPDSAKRQ